MRRFFIFGVGILTFILMAGCTTLGNINALISDNIPANASVNVAWGGRMCEAGGYIYYISDRNPEKKIIRMNQDGSNQTVETNGYYYISNLTADSDNLYFAARSESSEIDTIYSLSLNAGTARKVAEGNIRELQAVNGRLYWEEYDSPTGVIGNDATTTIQIKSVNPEGSDLKMLIDIKVPALNEGPFNFVVTESGIYYSKSSVNNKDYSLYSDVYQTDLSGENTVKLNSDLLRCVYNIFCDQGKIYFLMENDFSSDPFSSSIVTLDKEGKTQIILNHVGYFPQDFSCIEYCGISDGMIYYFDLKKTTDNSANILLNFHQYNIKTHRDRILLRGVNMGDSAVGTIASIRGKSIKGDSIGMYILGNDIYFEPFQMP